MRRLIVLVVILMGASADAWAQPQAFAPPTPGTIIITDATTYEIDSIEGTAIRTVSGASAPSTWLAACRSIVSSVEFDAADIDGFWPLHPGKTASAATWRGLTRWQLTLRVQGRDTVTVPAGSFAAWIVDVEETTSTKDYKALFRCWYAPEIGFTVKREHTVLAGTAPRQSFEVQRVERRDRSRSVEFRGPPPGTSFDTTLGVFRIDGTDGTNLVRRGDQAALNTTWVGGLVGYGSGDAVLDSAKRGFGQIWPLQLGKSVRFDIQRADGAAWHNTLTVERTELLKVPAGSYATFVIAHRERAANGSYDAEYLYWWSPALGFAIKRESRTALGANAPANYQLRAVRATQ